MSELTEQLREAAKCAPLWGSVFKAAADEIERLQKKESHLVNAGSVSKIKADAVREAIKWLEDNEETYGFEHNSLKRYANKLERGEL